jgi:hypothetical protein
MRFIITAGVGETGTKQGAAAGQPMDDRLIAAYMKFNEDMYNAGVLVAAEGLNPGAPGARVVVSNGRRKVLDGPFAETKELVGGFYVIEVPALEDAVAWALRCPVGLGTDDVLDIRPLTGESDIPPEVMRIVHEAAPNWSASFVKARA